MSPLRAVLFDLGNTLLYNPAPWPPILQAADRAVAEHLRAHGVNVNVDTFPGIFREHRHAYYAQRDKDQIESTTSSVLRDLLTHMQVDVPLDVQRGALDALYAITQTNWVAEDDAHTTLQRLADMGLRMGIISNAGDHKDVLALCDKEGITDYFDFILTSALCGMRKPHPRIFEVALSHWGLTPSEAAMVGDTPAADIAGANALGITSIFITRRAHLPAPAHIIPHITIADLHSLPPHLAPLA